VLVAKVPRLAGDNSQLDREARNLRLARPLVAGDPHSIPRVVAFEDFAGFRFLVETVVGGKPLRHDKTGQHGQRNIAGTLDWLVEFHRSSRRPGTATADWHERLIAEPLRVLDRILPAASAERASLEATRRMAERLVDSAFPLVFEHGDFAPPNILVDAAGRIGVVDWELAEPEGLPLVDAVFFLTSAAFARHGAKSGSGYVTAFSEAFQGARAWAMPLLQRYCAAIELDAELIRPIIVVCWARYLANIVTRLQPDRGAGTRLHAGTVDWLRENRYCRLWQSAIAGGAGIPVAA